jgi:hypothetical protein
MRNLVLKRKQNEVVSFDLSYFMLMVKAVEMCAEETLTSCALVPQLLASKSFKLTT